MRRASLAEYAFELAKVKPEEVRFVILDGSTAEGKDLRHSDYDVVVVKKGLLKQPGSVENLFGVFEGRVVSGWLADDESFKHQYVGIDDEQFLWRQRQLRKARLLYGRKEEFNKIIRAALARRWNKRRQLAVAKSSYVTMVEYMGKMLNKAAEAETPEFYQDGYIVAKNAALFVAAVNKINLDSDKSMYQQIFSQARIKPLNFERDFMTASGLTSIKRERKAVEFASRRLLRWARMKTIELFHSDRGNDSGFWKLVREVEF